MEDITYPLYFKCASKAQFETLNQSAAKLIGSDSYQQPLVDASGDYWLIVNSEISSLVNLEACVNFNSIVFPSNLI